MATTERVRLRLVDRATPAIEDVLQGIRDATRPGIRRHQRRRRFERAVGNVAAALMAGGALTAAAIIIGGIAFGFGMAIGYAVRG